MTNPKIKLSDLEVPPEDEVFNALLGSDLEVEDQDIEEILASYNIDTESIVRQFKSDLQQQIKKYAAEGKNPQELENLQFFVRDISNYQKARSTEAVEPKSWIKSILDNSNQDSFPGQLAYSYRGRKNEALSEEDAALIEEVEKELDQEE